MVGYAPQGTPDPNSGPISWPDFLANLEGVISPRPGWSYGSVLPIATKSDAQGNITDFKPSIVGWLQGIQGLMDPQPLSDSSDPAALASGGRWSGEKTIDASLMALGLKGPTETFRGISRSRAPAPHEDFNELGGLRHNLYRYDPSAQEHRSFGDESAYRADLPALIPDDIDAEGRPLYHLPHGRPSTYDPRVADAAWAEYRGEDPNAQHAMPYEVWARQQGERYAAGLPPEPDYPDLEQRPLEGYGPRSAPIVQKTERRDIDPTVHKIPEDQYYYNLFGSEPVHVRDTQYSIRDKDGRPVADFNTNWDSRNPESLYVASAYGYTPEGISTTDFKDMLGPAGVKAFGVQAVRDHPMIKRIDAERISGARAGGTYGGENTGAPFAMEMTPQMLARALKPGPSDEGMILLHIMDALGGFGAK